MFDPDPGSPCKTCARCRHQPPATSDPVLAAPRTGPAAHRGDSANQNNAVRFTREPLWDSLPPGSRAGAPSRSCASAPGPASPAEPEPRPRRRDRRGRSHRTGVSLGAGNWGALKRPHGAGYRPVLGLPTARHTLSIIASETERLGSARQRKHVGRRVLRGTREGRGAGCCWGTPGTHWPWWERCCRHAAAAALPSLPLALAALSEPGSCLHHSHFFQSRSSPPPRLLAGLEGGICPVSAPCTEAVATGRPGSISLVGISCVPMQRRRPRSPLAPQKLPPVPQQTAPSPASTVGRALPPAAPRPSAARFPPSGAEAVVLSTAGLPYGLGFFVQKYLFLSI